VAVGVVAAGLMAVGLLVAIGVVLGIGMLGGIDDPLWPYYRWQEHEVGALARAAVKDLSHGRTAVVLEQASADNPPADYQKQQVAAVAKMLDGSYIRVVSVDVDRLSGLAIYVTVRISDESYTPGQTLSLQYYSTSDPNSDYALDIDKSTLLSPRAVGIVTMGQPR
jgi:hypothetical protein